MMKKWQKIEEASREIVRWFDKNAEWNKEKQCFKYNKKAYQRDLSEILKFFKL